jgi:hypothetical protein
MKSLPAAVLFIVTLTASATEPPKTPLEQEVWNALVQTRTPPRTRQEAVYEAFLPVIKRLEASEKELAELKRKVAKDKARNPSVDGIDWSRVGEPR